MKVRNKAEADRERARLESEGKSTEGVEPGKVDWLYGTGEPQPEERAEESAEHKDKANEKFVTSNLWEDDEDNPIRGQVGYD